MYSLLYSLFLPFLLIRFLIRAIGNPKHLQGMKQRFGNKVRPLGDKVIWIHAVSVGETMAAKDLVENLLKQDHSIFLTNMTPTGSDTANRIFANHIQQHKLVQSFVPFDLPMFINKVIKSIRPKLLIIMETEIWPNMIGCCQKQSIPIIVANARLSERSFKGYRRFSWVIRSTLQKVTLFATQYDHDSNHFKLLGVDIDRITQTGNIKFDVEVGTKVIQQAVQYRTAWNLSNRLIICCASTHEGEEEAMLSMYNRLVNQSANLLLLIVPRHPERFQIVIKLSEEQGYVPQKLSERLTVKTDTQVLVGDTMGELPILFSLSDIVVMGGTLVPKGGHNFIEPAVVAKPILSGQYLFNFKEIASRLSAANGLIICQSADELKQQLLELIQNPAKQIEIGTNAQRVVADNKGALNKLLTAINSIILS